MTNETMILVIDDDLNDQALIKRAFRVIGIRSSIHFVNNGLEAIAYMMGEGQYSNRAK